jgi:organic radical activating enzyme
MNHIAFFGKCDINYINIIFRMNRICNFRCDYCSWCDNSIKFSTQNKIDEIINFIKTIDKKIKICITGGEPTINPFFLYFIFKINEIKNIEINLISNFSSDLNVYKELDESIKNIIFNFTYHKQKSKYDIKSFLDRCSNFKSKVIVSYMIEDNECTEEFLKYKDLYKNISLRYHPIYDCEKYKNVNIDHILEDENFRIDYEKSIIYEDGEYKQKDIKGVSKKFKNYYCLSYVYQLFIDHDATFNKCYMEQQKNPLLIKEYNYKKVIEKIKNNAICSHRECISSSKETPRIKLENIELFKNKEKCKKIFGITPDWIE